MMRALFMVRGVMTTSDTQDMQRICVIGPCGAGKSTFSRMLAARTGLPLYHLDQLYWQENWQKPDPQAWLDTVDTLIARPRWIIDGNYHSTLATRLARADSVVFLDYPRRVYLWRALKRIVLNYGRVRADSAPGCAERFDLEFMLYLWRFARDSRPKTLDALNRFGSGRHVAVFNTPRAAQDYLAALALGS